MDAAANYAAVYDAAQAAGRFPDHRLPGDHWADEAELFRLNPRRPLESDLLALASYLEPSDVLLDVGGGAGRVSLALADRVKEVVLVEPSASMREQFVMARDQAGIANTRIAAEWWLDSNETGDVAHVADVTYFVRDIVPFIVKLHNAAARRVMITVWRPTPGDMGAEPRRLVMGQQPPEWPGLPELAVVLWEMGLLPEIRPLSDQPWWLTDAERNLSEEAAIDLAMQRLDATDEATRQAVASKLDQLFDRTPNGLNPRWLSRPRMVLLTWDTRGGGL